MYVSFEDVAHRETESFGVRDQHQSQDAGSGNVPVDLASVQDSVLDQLATGNNRRDQNKAYQVALVKHVDMVMAEVRPQNGGSVVRLKGKSLLAGIGAQFATH
jgi:hypothetical protein